MGDKDIMPFGQYQGERMEDVPEDWFSKYWYHNSQWYLDNKKKDGGGSLTGFDQTKYKVLEYGEDCFDL